MTQEQIVVGIDVAKEKIDVAIRRGAEGCFATTPQGRRQLLAWLRSGLRPSVETTRSQSR